MSAWDWDKLDKQQRGKPQRPPGGGGGGGPGIPPEILEFFNRLKWFKGKSLLVWIAVALVVLFWLASGFYQVRPGHRGVVKIFGRVVGKPTLPGLHYAPPYPIAEVSRPKVTSVRQITLGGSDSEDPSGGGGSIQSQMLTKDARIISVKFIVQYKINAVQVVDYLFNVLDQRQTVKSAAAAALRAVVARTNFSDVLAKGRRQVMAHGKRLLQRILNAYRLGVDVVEVKLLNPSPPRPVVAAFDDVKKAEQEKVRYVRQAQEFRRKLLEAAYGEAKQMLDQAKAYREQKLRQAEGDTARFRALAAFLKLYGAGPQAKLARRITLERLYLEALEAVLAGSRKFVLSGRIGSRLLSHFGLGQSGPG
ncbi:MAG: FtsH protease activity modulator HflK, partial [Proteobacteria bacterium]|nr:FtsH protease activity modulator HflK [Pseudomonadota bacterium]